MLARWGEARSTNPAASMAGANGRERRREPGGGDHGGWVGRRDGAAASWSGLPRGEREREREDR